MMKRTYLALLFVQVSVDASTFLELINPCVTIKPSSGESLNSRHANPSPGSVSVIARPRLLFPERLRKERAREGTLAAKKSIIL